MKKSKIYRLIKKFYYKVKRIPRHPLQDSVLVPGYNICTLGSDYGGWDFVDDGSLHGVTIISAGLGEDASFDVEFAKKYAATVVILDPTPRSVNHYKKILSRIGFKKTQSYSKTGLQPVEAYDLENLQESQFVFIEKALWCDDKKLKFYKPQNPNNVSHSLINNVNVSSQNEAYIEVGAMSVESLINELNLNGKEIPILKIDIEGAEIEVLRHCMTKKIFPKQILVEFDTLNEKTPAAFSKVSLVDGMLRECGYSMLKTNGDANFLYFRENYDLINRK